MSAHDKIPLQLYLFGSPRLVIADEPLEINLRKAFAILTYLAVTRQAHTRDALATLFWPDKNQRTARANLRRTLYDLTQLLQERACDDLLLVESETVALNADVPLWTDVEALQQVVQQWLPTGHPVPSLDKAALAIVQGAAELYQGDFLADFTLPDAPAFDEWQFFRRDELRQLYSRLLQQLIASCQAHGNTTEAVAHARRLLHLDELEESAHRRLMRLYAETGQQAAALRQYEECVKILREELDIAPEAETTALYEAIRLRRFPASTSGSPNAQQLPSPTGDQTATSTQSPAADSAGNSSSSTPDTPLPEPSQTGQRGIPHNLPVQPTPFVGRVHELQDLLQRLSDQACRLISLIGPGGIGKTRLALAAAQQMVLVSGNEMSGVHEPIVDHALAERCARQFADGIFFVPLQSVTAPSDIVAAMAETVGFQFYSGEPPHEQLGHFLQEKAMLFILDAFEHLLDAATLLPDLLAVAPALKLMVTSREALKLQEEWFHPLTGLRLPPLLPQGTAPRDYPPKSFDAYDAVQLFLQTARRVTVNFDPTPHQEAIVRICRLVDGMPLGVELAAAWLKVFTCSQIADEIERGIDILVARHQNVPQRHRNMRVVMEQSLALLDSHTQQILQRLAFFQGGFDQAAATAVAGANLLTLADLVDKAWLYQPQPQRYQMHALLRQFVAAQLAADPAATEHVRRQHGHYYLRFLRSHEDALVGRDQRAALERISLDIENILSARQWFLEQTDWPATQQIMQGIFWFYLMRRRSEEGSRLFAETIANLDTTLAKPTLASSAAEKPALLAFKAVLLRRLGIFQYFLGEYTTAQVHLEESLAIGRSQQDRSAIAYALNILGVIHGWQGNGELAQRELRECLAIANEIGDQQTAADAYHELGRILAHSGELKEAKMLTQQGLARCRRLERPDWTAHALDTLGWATFCLGDYTTATECYEECLTIFQQLHHQLGIASALGGLGLIAWAKGDTHLAEARRLTEESLAICRTIGNRQHVANHLSDLTRIVAESGDNGGGACPCPGRHRHCRGRGQSDFDCV